MRSNIVFIVLAFVFVFPTGCDEATSESAKSKDNSLDTVEDSPDASARSDGDGTDADSGLPPDAADDDAHDATPSDSVGLPDSGKDGQIDGHSSQARETTLWNVEEWSVDNASYDRNPFDVIATVTFEHQGSTKKHKTQMFYTGDETWTFRFAGTRTGVWTYTSTSDDPELDDVSGKVEVREKSDPEKTGFLKTEDNKFVRQVDGDGNVEPIIWKVFNDEGEATLRDTQDYKLMSGWTERNIRAYATRARKLGMSHIFLPIYHQAFVEDAFGYDDHNESNPGLAEFRTLENVIRWARDEGVGVHFWMWGDEVRKWTPVGLSGGINGKVDRRIQRYIAARLGPMPGWTLAYGFDLEEWVTDDELNEWADFMTDRLGWPHPIMARKDNTNIPSTTVKSDGEEGPEDFESAVARLETDKPYVEEERFLLGRTIGDQTYDMDFTLSLLWRLSMAEGSGAIWGTGSDGAEYSAPDLLRTHQQFWSNRLKADMRHAGNLTSGIGMKTLSGEHYVFYISEASSIEVDLTGMDGSQPVVAVDTRSPYSEVDLGEVSPANQTLSLPEKSDWAVAIGTFD